VGIRNHARLYAGTKVQWIKAAADAQRIAVRSVHSDSSSQSISGTWLAPKSSLSFMASIPRTRFVFRYKSGVGLRFRHAERRTGTETSRGRSVRQGQLDHLEGEFMKTLKNLAIIATLLVAGTSLAIAQNGPATGGQPPAGSAVGASGAPAPSAKSTHKHKQVKQAPAASDTKE
jgi:hypothetical protein